MQNDELYDIPPKCPITGGPLYISELTNEESGTTIRGKFRIPKTAMVDQEQQQFLEVFLRSRGVISTVEKELGISYPTVRARLDSLLESLELPPLKEDKQTKKRAKDAEAKRRILEMLEEGKITASEAKAKMRSETRK